MRWELDGHVIERRSHETVHSVRACSPSRALVGIRGFRTDGQDGPSRASPAGQCGDAERRRRVGPASRPAMRRQCRRRRRGTAESGIGDRTGNRNGRVSDRGPAGRRSEDHWQRRPRLALRRGKAAPHQPLRPGWLQRRGLARHVDSRETGPRHLFRHAFPQLLPRRADRRSPAVCRGRGTLGSEHADRLVRHAPLQGFRLARGGGFPQSPQGDLRCGAPRRARRGIRLRGQRRVREQPRGTPRRRQGHARGGVPHGHLHRQSGGTPLRLGQLRSALRLGRGP